MGLAQPPAGAVGGGHCRWIGRRHDAPRGTYCAPVGQPLWSRGASSSTHQGQGLVHGSGCRRGRCAVRHRVRDCLCLPTREA